MPSYYLKLSRVTLGGPTRLAGTATAISGRSTRRNAVRNFDSPRTDLASPSTREPCLWPAPRAAGI